MGDLVSRAAVKTRLDMSDVSTFDSTIDAIITSVSAQVARYCRRVFESAAYTHYFDGSGSDTICLRQYPVTVLTSVHVSGTRDTYDSSTVIASADYFIDTGDPENRGILKFDYPLSSGNKNVRVVYTAGYSTLPTDLVEAALRWVVAVFNRRRSYGSSSESWGDGSVSYEATAMPADVVALLDPFVKGVESD